MFPLTGDDKQQRMCIVDGLDHALVYNWNGDNDGPSGDPTVYEKRWKEISVVFPNAEIIASTFDNFTQHLDGVKDRLPVVTAEVGDSWIYGVPSDPQKVSRMKIINRELDLLAARNGGSISNVLKDDSVLRNATRFALKVSKTIDNDEITKN